MAVCTTHKQSLAKLVLYSVVAIVAKCDKMFPTLRGIVQLFILNICAWSYCGRAVCEGHKDRRVRRRTLHSVNFIHTIVSILAVRQWKGVAISFQTFSSILSSAWLLFGNFVCDSHCCSYNGRTKRNPEWAKAYSYHISLSLSCSFSISINSKPSKCEIFSSNHFRFQSVTVFTLEFNYNKNID